MRLTLAMKMGFGIGTLLSLFIVVGVLFCFQTHSSLEKLKEIIEVKEPISAAAYEMEINAIGTGLGVLKHLSIGNPESRKRVEKDEADFKEFHAKYMRIAKTRKEKELGEQVGSLYRKYIALGKTLMNKKDHQETQFEAIAENIEQIDIIIDKEIKAKLDNKDPDGLKTLLESSQMEADIAEVVTWLDTYLRIPKEQYKERIFSHAEQFRQQLAEFKKLNLTEEEKLNAANLEGVFNRTVSLAGDILVVNDYIQKNLPKFVDMRTQIDVLLDEEIQAITHFDLAKAKVDAYKTTRRGYTIIIVVLILALMVGILAGTLLSRSVTIPVSKLVVATERVAKGDLSPNIEYWL